MSLLLDRSVASEAPRIEAGIRVAGLDPETLVGDHGSPLFVYDLDVAAARVAMLRAAMPDGVEVAYAVKANPSPAILRHLASLGLGADIASGGELVAVTRTGFDLGRVVMTGPGKTDAEIAAAVRAGVRAITMESLEEVDVLLDMASLAGRHQGLMLRLAADETFFSAARLWTARVLSAPREPTQEEIDAVPPEVARAAYASAHYSIHHPQLPGRVLAVNMCALPWLARAEPAELFLPAAWAQRILVERSVEQVLSWFVPFAMALGFWFPRSPRRVEAAPGRNAPCPCGSGKKHKRCCGSR